MVIIDSRIQKIENEILTTYHPETNIEQVYDFGSGKWLNEILSDIRDKSLTEEEVSLLIKEEMSKHSDTKGLHIEYKGDTYDESRLITSYKNGLTVERLVLSSSTEFEGYIGGHVVIETYRNILDNENSWRGFQRATYYSSSVSTVVVYNRGARGTSSSPTWGNWQKTISNSDLATTEKLGIMQVGTGLSVANGVVSSQCVYDIDKTLDNPITDYINGITVTPVNTNTSNVLHNQLGALINELTGWSVGITYFRFVLTTTKRSVLSMTQEVVVYSNLSGTLGTEICRLSRVASFTSPYDWGAWRINMSIISHKGTPNGSLHGLKGWLCLDVTGNTLYIKTTGISTTYNAGWVAVDTSGANYYIDNTKTLDSVVADFSTGQTIGIPTVSATNTFYKSCIDLVNTVLGFTMPYAVSFRFKLTTIKRDSSAVWQELEVCSNTASTTGAVLFTLKRTLSDTTPVWRIDFNTLASSGNPNGSIGAPKGVMCLDIVDNVLYVKTTGTSSVTNTGWVNVANSVDEKISNHLNDYEYQLAKFVDFKIQLTKSSNTNRVLFRLEKGIATSFGLSISLDGGKTSKDLVDVRGNKLEFLDIGFHEVVETGDFFILRNKSGGVKPEELQALVKIANEAESDDSSLRKEFIDAINEARPATNLPATANWYDTLAQIPNIRNGELMFASGVVKSTTTSANFVYVNGTSSTTRYFIEFKELKFKPKILIAFNYVTTGSITLYIESSDGNTEDTVKTLTFSTGNASGYIANFKANASTHDGYVNSTGFKIPVGTGGRDYSFIAFG